MKHFLILLEHYILYTLTIKSHVEDLTTVIENLQTADSFVSDWELC